MKGLGSIKRSGTKSGMAKLKGLNSIAKKGKSQLMAQRVNGGEMRTKGAKGLTSVAKGLPRVTKGGWSEYAESFNKPSGAERQASHYSKGNDWSK